jgi:hypothetical protein
MEIRQQDSIIIKSEEFKEHYTEEEIFTMYKDHLTQSGDKKRLKDVNKTLKQLQNYAKSGRRRLNNDDLSDFQAAGELIYVLQSNNKFFNAQRVTDTYNEARKILNVASLVLCDKQY